LNIFLVSSDTSRPVRAIVFGWKRLFATVVTVVALFLICAFAMNYAILRWAVATNHPWLQNMALADQRAESAKVNEKMQGQLSAMAVRIGELQAQLSQVESSSERLAKQAGLTTKAEAPKPGQGGIELEPQNFTPEELENMIDDISQRLAEQTNQIDVLDVLTAESTASKNFFPSLRPLQTAWRSSSFGYRVDPFTGRKAYHSGLDFAAESGTPIVAAASGKVIRADRHSQYGKIVDIDHGNGLITRYAHCSEVLVNVGDVVVRGQAIAAVGSTGRSTGPHLHFEVRLNNVPQNPLRFLDAGRYAKGADKAKSARR
jgi:murein DD-endopeptidase MepM/ murein hydrolase activator NlpD